METLYSEFLPLVSTQDVRIIYLFMHLYNIHLLTDIYVFISTYMPPALAFFIHFLHSLIHTLTCVNVLNTLLYVFLLLSMVLSIILSSLVHL